MILMKLLQRDVLRKKVVLSIVFLLIMLSTLLVAAGSNLIVELSGALDTLFAKARVPHFVQMHAGSIDRAAIEEWAAENELAEEVQTAEMLSIDGASLLLDETHGTEENSVMDIGFVRQNESFDFLLDTGNRIIHPGQGEIAVPVYYAENRDIAIGDRVLIRHPSLEMELRVCAFLRDAQMNPSIIHSKRFLVHESDYARLRAHVQEREYLIEFLLTDPERAGEFADLYLASGLPTRGPSVDHSLFRTLNALSEGIVAAVVIMLSVLLMSIALLCLRFTMIASLEEDQREIGVMKAVGMAPRSIKRLYLGKYLLIAAVACLLGYFASHTLGWVLSAQMRFSLGSAPAGGGPAILPIAAAAGIFLIVLLSCLLILRRVDRISAVQALRGGEEGSAAGGGRKLPLQRGGLLDVNVALGLRDAVQRFRLFGLLCFVFFFCACIVILPVHFLGTITSPGFVSYMGIGKSDLRIDLRHSDEVETRYETLLARIAADGQVERSAALVTSRFTMVGEQGEEETISVETGDFSVFPLDYLAGEAPREEDEIALSYLSSGDMEKEVGNHLTLLVDGTERRMRICGIYQDVTNGGRTAKAAIPCNRDEVLWYTVSLDLAPGADPGEKRQEYAQLFPHARVTDMESYISQTLGGTISQLATVTRAAVAIGAAVSLLITSLFLTMLIAKDASRIAIMKSLGFTLRHLRIQYLSTAVVLLAVGLLLGTLFSNTAGSRIAGLVWGSMGAPQISFVIDPLRSYLLLPALLAAAVTLATVLSTGAVRDHTIAR